MNWVEAMGVCFAERSSGCECAHERPKDETAMENSTTSGSRASGDSTVNSSSEPVSGTYSATMENIAKPARINAMPTLLGSEVFAPWKMEFHKACWRTVNALGYRNVMSAAYPDSLNFYDVSVYPGVKGLVALTLDDAPCSRHDACYSMVAEVRALLQKYDAQATFFLCSDYAPGHEESLRELLADGHEVANHACADRSYATDTAEEFEAALLETERICEDLRSPSSGVPSADVKREACCRWFRAPHGRVSNSMREVLRRHGFTNVLTDCYANDPWISDVEFLSATMLDMVSDGSVAVIHMPERGFREYNLQALDLFLKGLSERKLRAVSLSMLHQASVNTTREASVSVPDNVEKSSEAPLVSYAVRGAFHKMCWKAITAFAHRQSMSIAFPDAISFYDTFNYPGAMGLIALTIDDAPCSQDADMSLIAEVKSLLQEFDARATFFLCSDYVVGYEKSLEDLLMDGHEVANHGCVDRSYANDSEEEFETAFLKAENVCERLRSAAICPGVKDDHSCAVPLAKWFRAPHGRLSNPMRRVLNRHGFMNVLTDCYANDPWIADPAFISQTMLDMATDGSIAVIHMPEKGFREYNLLALRTFLAGLRSKGLQVVNLSTLHVEAHGSILMPNGSRIGHDGL